MKGAQITIISIITIGLSVLFLNGCSGAESAINASGYISKHTAQSITPPSAILVKHKTKKYCSRNKWRNIVNSSINTVTVQELQKQLGNENPNAVILTDNVIQGTDALSRNDKLLVVVVKNQKRSTKFQYKALRFKKLKGNQFLVKGLNLTDVLLLNPRTALTKIAQKDTERLSNTFEHIDYSSLVIR